MIPRRTSPHRFPSEQDAVRRIVARLLFDTSTQVYRRMVGYPLWAPVRAVREKQTPIQPPSSRRETSRKPAAPAALITSDRFAGMMPEAIQTPPSLVSLAMAGA